MVNMVCDGGALWVWYGMVVVVWNGGA